MVRRINVGKIVITVFLTALIWVWADLALDDEFAVSNAAIHITTSVDPSLWVSFDGRSTVPLKKLVLRGSARKVADARRRINDGSVVPEFFFDPQHEQITKAGTYSLNAADFLRTTDTLRQLTLIAASCEPNSLTVDVVELQKKNLTVKCFDQSQNLVKAESIDPAQVAMFVPADWSGDALTAEVILTRSEIEQARLAPVQKAPFIELSEGAIRQAATPVKITTPPQQERLQTYTITNVRLGFSFSANLQGKYRVELVNPDVVMSAVTIKATPEAKAMYDNMTYHVILEINDTDRDVTSADLRRQLVYNLPQEFVRKDEIVLAKPPDQARFRLVPISPEQPQSAQPHEP